MYKEGFNLGSAVDYVRQHREEVGKMISGRGVVRAILVDHLGRRVVQIFDASQKAAHQTFNVDILAVNPSDDFKARYAFLLERIAMLSAEGNKMAEEVIRKYNSEIEKAYNEVLGEPVDVSLFKPAEQAAANEEKKAA